MMVEYQKFRKIRLHPMWRQQGQWLVGWLWSPSRKNEVNWWFNPSNFRDHRPGRIFSRESNCEDWNLRLSSWSNPSEKNNSIL